MRLLGLGHGISMDVMLHRSTLLMDAIPCRPVLDAWAVSFQLVRTRKRVRFDLRFLSAHSGYDDVAALISACQSTIFSRGLPFAFPSSSSMASILLQPSVSTSALPVSDATAWRSSGDSLADTPESLSRSSQIALTVSLASGMFVPMMPVGPRLSHPATYSPGITEAALSSVSTRPPFDGTTALLLSKGTPSIPRERYPTDVSSNCAGRTTLSPVSFAFCRPGGPSSAVTAHSTPDTRPSSPSTRSGLRKKRTESIRGESSESPTVSEGGGSSKPLMKSNFFFNGRDFEISSRDASLLPLSISWECTWQVVPSSRVTSRSSLMVNAICAGPLRPTSDTWLMLDERSAERACSQMSEEARAFVFESRTRAQSIATLP
mmetsp:Transcript_411/g.811  ORF Transcript_411/g.811 Transcript_411/m.811 type:complete len:376 (-) Transcript_411:558-1685(-)